ncbi:MAG TPA: DUF6445 family protein [Steroidobacteraceae bacterium]
MILHLHPDIRVQKLTIGTEQAPLLVIDNFVADADKLIGRAAWRQFVPSKRFFPGARVEAPPAYQQLIVNELRNTLADYFQLGGGPAKFAMCHYSLVTTPPAQLTPIQALPHIDSLHGDELASVHYLFKADLGGTAFYRHRKTGFESVDAARSESYFQCLEEEKQGPDRPAAAYIHGDTALFEQIAKQDGVFNRMLVYRRNSLHSACISPHFVPDPNPLTGRLSINSFIAFES